MGVHGRRRHEGDLELGSPDSPWPHGAAPVGSSRPSHSLERSAGARACQSPTGTETRISVIDRLMHHAHVVLTAGDSIRLTQATAGKGVTPLAR